jgi:hypothetical protein
VYAIRSATQQLQQDQAWLEQLYNRLRQAQQAQQASRTRMMQLDQHRTQQQLVLPAPQRQQEVVEQWS